MASSKDPYIWEVPKKDIEIELKEVGDGNRYMNVEDRRQQVLNDLDDTFAQIRA